MARGHTSARISLGNRAARLVQARLRSWVERAEQLSRAAVDIVASIAARDRAERSAADSIATMLMRQVTLTEAGERCGLPLKEVTRLKRCYLESSVPAPADTMSLDNQLPSGPTLHVNGGQRS